jgi:sortase A
MPRVNKIIQPALKKNRPTSDRHRQTGRSVRYGFGLIGLMVITGIIMAYPYTKAWTWEANSPSIVMAHVVVDSSDQLAGNPTRLTDERRILIPSIGVDSPIVEGQDESALNLGAWRIPGTSTPDNGGNTVISGHRFKYLPPNNTTFYLLDKLRPDDAIQIQWNSQLYHYRVVATREVKPDQVEILENTSEARLTLFTCTPILSTARRLVVTAELTGITDGS